MKTMSLPVPGLVFGSYPERGVGQPRSHDGIAALNGVAAKRRYGRDVRLAQRRCDELLALPTRGVEALLDQLRAKLSRDGLTDKLVAETFGFVSSFCARTLGMRPFSTQLMAARIMLDNRLAEMATGEGKTLSAAVCAATAGLAGIPVHVITSNDYLVERDAEQMRPLLDALKLRVDCVTQDMRQERRRTAYAADITYCTAKELVFDYLRDTMSRSGRRSELHSRVAVLSGGSQAQASTLLRGLCLAIIDEADSILLDEARVPLILAQRSSDDVHAKSYELALGVAGGLRAGTDYRLDHNRRIATLSLAGRDRVEQIANELKLRARNRMHRDELVCQALAALHLYARDRDYIVKDDAVVIVDETTGRVAPGRIWSRGLHQLIECKEGCNFSGEQVTARQITYQRFFRKYLSLGGMSGTMREASAELRAVYGLDVVRVPLRQPDRRSVKPTRLFSDRDAMWAAVVSETAQLQKTGQPVLVGTDSVAESDALSDMLSAAGVTHRVLNARQDKAEADIVAKAGEVGSVTVATNMAGRGTDIPLGPGAAERGGLHVISCQHNTSRRIDRQLIGRCARQGDPGSAETFLYRDHALIRKSVPRWLTNLFASRAGRCRPQWLVETIRRLPQILEEGRQRAQRRAMLDQDIKLDRALASADGME